MKRTFIILFILLACIGCDNDRNAPTPDIETELQHPDWHILRAPKNREIYAVHGDIDGTLLISDRFRIYFTKDKGKTWTLSDYNPGIGLAGFAVSNDTIFVLDTESSSSADPGNRYASRPYYFSIDGGETWKELKQRPGSPEMQTPINYAFSGNGIRFSIDQVIQSNGMINYLGIKTENGRKIAIPYRHVLNSINFDRKSRLYVTASRPFCDLNGNVEFCDQEDFRGTLYVSKKNIDF